jgi:hypothetical protein
LPERRPNLPASRLDEANESLRQGLADRPRPANEVKAEAKEAGVSIDALLAAKRHVRRFTHTGDHPVRP